MKTRKLGNSGLEVSALGFGAMGLSFPNAPTRDESIKLLRSAVEHGITFFDTAQGYAQFPKFRMIKFIRVKFCKPFDFPFSRQLGACG